jgi:hypothetical protein
MFRIAGTTDKGRRRACTATATQALRQHSDMTVAGLAPVITDLKGRKLSLEALHGRARLEAIAS